MYSLVRHHTLRELAAAEAPALALALLIAERFYKFGSFTLECGAFLATWWAGSFLLRGLTTPTGRR